MTDKKLFKHTIIGLIPKNWQLKTLPSLLVYIVDNRGKTVPTSEVGIPLIATNCIKEDALYPKMEKLRYISQETYNTWFRAHPVPNDILFVNKGTPGQVCLVPDPVNLCIAQDMVALRVNNNEINWKFLFAYFRSKLFKKQIEGLNVGTTIPHLKKTIFDQIYIPIPSRFEQEIIGNIYFILSQKIELNLQMNKTLESIAQTIFKEWFVNFNYPEFDGKLDNDLPIGWKVGNLGEILTLIYGKALKAETRVDGAYPVIGSSGIVGYHNEYLVEAPGIVIGRKGTIGEVIWIDKNFFPIDTTFYIKDLIGASDLYYHYYLLKEQEFKKITSDSAVPGLNRNQALNNKIVIPNFKLIEQYNLIVKPLFERKNLINKEIILLTQLRDALLPKLMSGKLEIKE